MRRLAAIAALCLAPLLARADGWIETLDIPLMPGLVVNADSETVFETAEGRVVVVRAAGPVAREAVESYYASALPGLGWNAGPGGELLRDGERMELEIRGQGGETAVTFRLAPR
ncbi:MAG: hypothetical protein TEF_16515 [Rhizobiales bacterium NRL2]|jgi:hypothetical protein|nr:MAG: hypothetical protein TEF_16515 [Rhizobiales bacterium NRL2]